MILSLIVIIVRLENSIMNLRYEKFNKLWLWFKYRIAFSILTVRCNFFYKCPIKSIGIFSPIIQIWIRQISFPLSHSVLCVLFKIYAFAEWEGEGALNDINCHTYIGWLLPNCRPLLFPSISHTSLSVV